MTARPEHVMVAPDRQQVGPSFSMPRGKDRCNQTTQNWSFILRSMGLIGLAVAVFLWGLSYKVSLYHAESQRTKATVAKVWVGPRPKLVDSGRERGSKSSITTPQFVWLAGAYLFWSDNHTKRSFPVTALLKRRCRLILNSLRSPPQRID